MKSVMIMILFCALAASGCGGRAVRDNEALNQQYHPSDKEAVREMLKIVLDHNGKAPRSLSAEFTLDGVQREKKFRMIGNIQYDQARRAMHAAFFDYIFKTPVLVFLAEGDVLRLYYPVDKKLYVENAKGIDLADYGGPAIQVGLLLDLVAGGIPLIPKYRVMQGLDANSGSGRMLLLESPHYFETISFQENSPDKVLLIDRDSRDRFEIYLKKRVDQADGSFFSNIMLVTAKSGLKIDIRFRNIRLHGPVTVKTVRDLKLPADTRIITNR